MRSLFLAVMLLCSAVIAHAQRASLLGSLHVSTPEVAWRHLLPEARPASVTPQAVRYLALPSAFSYERLGLFCKAEYHLHRWLPIPVLIRIGDVERDEEVDGKGAYRQAW